MAEVLVRPRPTQYDEGHFSVAVNYSYEFHEPKCSFEVSHPLQTFMSLRLCLVANWPLVYIPPLISIRSQFTKASPTEVHTQSQLILQFLQEVVQSRHLYDSPEFRQFILEPANLHTSVEHWYEQAEKYKSAFPNWDNFVVTGEEANELLSGASNLRDFITKILAVKDACRETGRFFRLVKEQSQFVTTTLIDYMSDFCAFTSEEALTSHRTPRMFYASSFDSLYRKFTLLEVKAHSMIETLERVKELEVQSAKLREQLRISNQKLIDLQAGKLTLWNMFSKRNEEAVWAQDTIVRQTESNLNGIMSVKRIGITRLLKEEFPAFLTHLKTQFQDSLEEYNRSKTEELNGLTSAWRP
eukprot:CAMPEP_0204900726 /NCGR_PEP_ID=MMETSP1397-20131031/2644_1 /ASSEMBLY_ACC=CAM_ASM_000891 /TAXON_ID=49980 /ORGANISM="Climacostomum Climacostomum virens, Strain Stock W-24" /LENGTH=355 /DNA_ID=CAMNT_0052068933 /DNA_START=485 /DNA_END=1548 /DNA_ORIENTATION=-